MRRLFLALLLALAASPAYAVHQADMFGDMEWGRPPVPSDREYAYTGRADMFPASEPMMRSGKDMFDFVRPPGNPGIERHFSAHIWQAPDQTLYHWPQNQY